MDTRQVEDELKTKDKKLLFDIELHDNKLLCLFGLNFKQYQNKMYPVSKPVVQDNKQLNKNIKEAQQRMKDEQTRNIKLQRFIEKQNKGK